MRFKFCPECGKKLIEKEIGEEELVPYCESCKRPFFDCFGQCVIVTVINEYNEILLLRQNYISRENWVLISGFIKNGDTAEETAIREVMEETGQKSTELNYISSYYYEKHDLLMLGFFMKVQKRAFKNSNEVDDLKWFAIEKVKTKLRKGSIAEEHFSNCIKTILSI